MSKELKVRIQKLMSEAGVASRRESEELIRAGRVTLNGRLAKLGDQADPVMDEVRLDGRLFSQAKEKFVYIALHKPKGVISSLEDELEEGRITVRDLINLPGHLYPVGRLDKPSEGLILMTNDGQLAHKLTHPRYGHEKQYEVWLEGQISPAALEQWRRGVILDGKITAPAPIQLLQQSHEGTQLKIILREGRKRQIRRIAAMFGYAVRRLVRQRIGPVQLGQLKSGEWRHLTPDEVAQLRAHVDSAWPVAKSKAENRPDSRLPAASPPKNRTASPPSARPSAKGRFFRKKSHS